MYQSFYKLSGKPFRLSPDPSFFFPSRGHKRALAYLRYGLNQDEGFVVITGAPGTGKTTLAKILLQELGDKNLVVAHLTTTQLEADDMLRMVAASFGLRYEGLDKAGLLKSLEQFLLARARERKRALLVIDEAQNLPERSLEELRMLSNLQVGDKALVQTFMLGQAQFRQMLDHPDLEQLRQRVIANYHLSPLAGDECQRYIESRLHQVGWQNDPQFAEIAYEMIQQYTDGIPRRINMLCDRIMLYSCMEELHHITGEVVTLVIKELELEISGDWVAPDVEEQEQAETQATSATNSETRTAATEPQSQETQPEEKQQANSKDSNSHAQRVEELSDKLKANKASTQKENTKEEQTPSPDNSSSDKKAAEEEASPEVMGNTVTKKKPEAAETADTTSPSQTEIDERDLFRVIPGGKSDSAKPTEQPGALTRPIAPAAQAQPSQEDVLLRRILRLVLAFHRSPSRFPGLDNANQPLPDGITELLELAISDDQTLTRVSPAAVMGISPMMLRAAVRFFVRRAFFVVDGDDYRVLGLKPGAPQPLIERHYDLLMRLLRQDKQRGSADSVARIGNAYEALSRLDQAKQAVHRPAPSRSKPAVAEQAVESGEHSDELTIDFDKVTTQPDKRAPAFGKKPHEAFDPQAAISHRRLRYAGQIAILGFGALVIVLGMYIVQLGPSDVDKPRQTIITQKFGDEEAASGTENRSPLSFDDGSSRQSMDSDRFDRLTKAPEEPSAREEPSAQEKASAHEEASAQEEASTQKETIAALPSEDETSSADENIIALDSSTASEPKQTNSGQTRSDKTATSKSFASAPEDTHADTMLAASATPTTAASSAKQNAVDAGKPVHKAENPAATVKAQSYPGIDIEPVEHPVASTKSSTANQADIEPGAEAVAVSQKQVDSPSSPASAANSSVNIAKASPSVPGAPNAILPDASATDSQSATVAKAAPAVPKKAAITQKDLNDLIKRLSSAYEKGDLNKIMTLFAQNARTNNRTTLAGIRSDYADLFKTSSFREIAINSVFWEIDGQSARGVGDYRARVNPLGTNGSQTFLGKVTLQVSKRGDDLALTRFYFSNQKVISGAAQSISQADMQNLVGQLINDYNQGDIDGLMALFAEDAHTNDQTTLAGIRKDYLDLFNSTDSRQLSLDNMTWQSTKDTASGNGDFKVVVKGKGSDTTNTYKGTIKIEAKRVKNRILITRWLHNLQ